jgi:tetratricopeptide (TPR) repeat protein
MYVADLRFSSGYKSENDTDPEPSRLLLQQAVDLNPLEPFYQSELGQVYAISATNTLNESEREKFADKALFWGQKAVGSSPAILGYYRTLLTIYIELMDNDPSLASQAVSVASRAVALAPTEPKVLYNLAALENRLGDNQAAATAAKHVTELKPDYREAYLLWAQSLDDNNGRAEAIQVYKVVRKLFPQEMEAKVRLKEWTGSED